MTDLAALYGLETKTDQVEIVVSCDWAVNVVVTDSDQVLDFTAFNGFANWQLKPLDTKTIRDEDKLTELTISNIAPVVRSGVYDVGYLIELTPTQTVYLWDYIGKTIYGDLLISDGSSQKVVRRFEAKVMGRALR